MSFCPKCGRQRNANGRFCGGCGHEFAQQPADNGAASATDPGEPATSVPPGQTRWDAPVEQTRWDRPLDGMRPNTVVSGYEAAPPVGEATPPSGAPAEQLEAADTVYAEPAGAGYAPPYTPPAQPAPAYEYEPQPAPGPAYQYAPPPGPPPLEPESQGRRPGRRMTGAFVIVAIVVVVAAGGGAYAFARSQRHTTPPTQPTGAATGQASTGRPTAAPSTSPPVTSSPSPTASPSASPTPSPTHTGTVQVAAGVAGDPAEPQVEAYLNRYFSAINAHNYSAYNSLLDAQEQQGNSRATFDSGYATTKDSNEVLTGIDDTGGGNVTAHVSFTSRQNPTDSVDGSACNDWQISLYLVPQGNSYVMTAAPAGYHAAYADC